MEFMRDAQSVEKNNHLKSYQHLSYYQFSMFCITDRSQKGVSLPANSVSTDLDVDIQLNPGADADISKPEEQTHLPDYVKYLKISARNVLV